ncbi:MAG: hypothetical protein ACOX7F_04790 [Eubacteriales bacterium]|jgi:hypothetical protein
MGDYGGRSQETLSNNTEERRSQQHSRGAYFKRGKNQMKSASKNEREKEKKKKKSESILENYIYSVMRQSMKKCLDAAIDDLLKDWK